MIIKMNLKKRILLGYLVPLALMLGVAAAVYWSIGTLRQITDSLDHSNAIDRQVRDVDRDLIQMQRSTRGYLLSKNESSRGRYKTAVSDVEKGLRSLSETVKDPAQLENLRRLSELSKRMEAEEQQYFDLVDAGKAVAAVKLFATGRSVELVGELDILVHAMERHESEIVEARREAQSSAMAQLMTIAVGATALAVILALVLGAWIAARISRSIGEAIAGMSTSSTEIAATVDEHERVVTQQAAAVSETTTTIEELGASSRQSATQAESMAEAAKQSLDATQDGIRLANQVSASMTGMKQKVGSVAEQILRLSEQAGQIGGIAKVVGELAGETNMLALNAAVEAARVLRWWRRKCASSPTRARNRPNAPTPWWPKSRRRPTRR